MHTRITGGRKIPGIGVIRPFAVVDVVDQFRDNAVQVQVALPVSMAGHVHRYAVHHHRKVGAVIQIKAAQIKLVGLARAAVLGRQRTGYDFNQLTGSRQGSISKLRLPDYALRCRCRHA